MLKGAGYELLIARNGDDTLILAKATLVRSIYS